MLELDCGYEFEPARELDFFEALPARPGVLRLDMHDADAEPYLAKTADIRRAAERLLSAPDAGSKRLNLREVTARIRYRVTGSKFEQALVHYENARASFPRSYQTLARLRPPAMLKISLRNAYPRCYATRKLLPGGFYLGPFPSRKSAETFAEGFLDFFKVRRCQIKILRDPQFPGCMYSEMKMCLAPCFAGCTKEEYDGEVARLLGALASKGESLEGEFAQEREAASEALDFERAAAEHKKIEKLGGVLRGLPEIIRRVEHIDAVILQRAAETKAETKTIVAFPVRGGMLGEPIQLHFGLNFGMSAGEVSSEPRSVEEILRGGLEAGEAAGGDREAKDAGEGVADRARSREALAAAPRELGEHLALLTRWFYSNPREGEIFFKEGAWPYRRILRACNRLLVPDAAGSVKPKAGLNGSNGAGANE